MEGREMSNILDLCGEQVTTPEGLADAMEKEREKAKACFHDREVERWLASIEEYELAAKIKKIRQRGSEEDRTLNTVIATLRDTADTGVAEKAHSLMDMIGPLLLPSLTIVSGLLFFTAWLYNSVFLGDLGIVIDMLDLSLQQYVARAWRAALGNAFFILSLTLIYLRSKALAEVDDGQAAKRLHVLAKLLEIVSVLTLLFSIWQSFVPMDYYSALGWITLGTILGSIGSILSLTTAKPSATRLGNIRSYGAVVFLVCLSLVCITRSLAYLHSQRALAASSHIGPRATLYTEKVLELGAPPTVLPDPFPVLTPSPARLKYDNLVLFGYGSEKYFLLRLDQGVEKTKVYIVSEDDVRQIDLER
jgi:hypothetical protein